MVEAGFPVATCPRVRARVRSGLRPTFLLHPGAAAATFEGARSIRADQEMTATATAQLIDDDLREELAEIAAEAACELLEIEHRGGVLRFVLDHPDGITVEHCEAFSKQVSALLDVEDFGDRSYVLEVTSPGLDRKLYGPADYRRFAGKLARVTLRDDAGRRRTIVADIGDLADSPTPTLTLHERETRQTHQVPLQAIERARLEIDL